MTHEVCELEFPPADEETGHLLVFNETGGPICPGTLRALDLEVERLAEWDEAPTSLQVRIEPR